MTGPRRERLTEEEARALWDRALELQLEAVRREDDAASGQFALESADGGGPGSGLPVDEVTAAGREAGIGEEFMALALVERGVTRKQLRWMGGRGGRASRRILPDQPRAIEVGRTIRASPEAVLEGVRRIFPALPYHLELEDAHGEDPTRDGILVFRVPGMQAYTGGATFAWEMAYGTVTHLLLSIRPAGDGGPDAPAASTVTLRAPLLEHTRQSYWLGLVSAGIVGLGGGGVALALGFALVGGLAVPAALAGGLLAGSAGLGIGGGGAFGTWAARKLYFWGIGKARDSLERLLQVLDVNARTGGGFPRPQLPAGPGDTGASSILLGS